MVDWDSIVTNNHDRDVVKERLDLDALKTKLELLDEINTKTALLVESKKE